MPMNKDGVETCIDMIRSKLKYIEKNISKSDEVIKTVKHVEVLIGWLDKETQKGFKK